MTRFIYNDGCAGVYAIINTITRDVYVGSSQNMYQRWLQHRTMLRNHTHHNTALQLAYDRYGPRAFRCVVIEYIINDDDRLRSGESWYIRELQATYNIRSGKLSDMDGFTPRRDMADVYAMIQHGPYIPPRWTRTGRYVLSPRSPEHRIAALRETVERITSE